MKQLFTFLLVLSSLSSFSQSDSVKTGPKKKEWYDYISVRGYAQVRYNRLFETNPQLKCEQCDASWGEGGGFFLRRIRVIFYGQISERVYFYIQPDFASAASSNNLHFAQIRDAYFDIGIDKDNEFRFRIGQSKVPYGFENMQSSSNRLPLDRNDALNSALKNERDLGIFFYWAPTEVRQLYRWLSREGLKHSGDYGAFGFGVFNGQTANRPEVNDNKHVVMRFTYPISIGSQIIEPGIQAYTGKYELTPGQISEGVGIKEDANYIDQRVAASFVLYPQPFGIQTEFNIGEGPEFNKATDSIEVQNIHGGYMTLSYLKKFGDHRVIPFVRGQYYSGGKKHERDARSYDMRELELGIEWQPMKNFELVAMYTFSSRRFEDYVNQDNKQAGSLLRLQAQLNF